MKRVGRKEPTERRKVRGPGRGQPEEQRPFPAGPKGRQGQWGEGRAAEEGMGAETRGCRTLKGLGFDASFTQ